MKKKTWTEIQKREIIAWANDKGVASAVEKYKAGKNQIYGWRAYYSNNPAPAVTAGSEAIEKCTNNAWTRLSAENQKLRNIIVDLMLKHGEI